MIGKDLYKVEVNAELSNERLKSLTFFYEPLIGKDALYTYQYMILKGNVPRFCELNDLLTSLNISADDFEKHCDKLNEYRLLKTLKKDNQYIFSVLPAMTMRKFAKDDLFVRDFILKTSGKHYQEVIADLPISSNYAGFKDVSKTFDSANLSKWSSDDETYLNKKIDNTNYEFNTLFNVNTFLKDISTNLLPIKFRTADNLRQMAILADLYNITYDKMKSFIPKIAKIDSNSIDIEYLKYLCIHSTGDYTKVSNDEYNVPCVTYLMSLQDGKEVTEYDKKLIFKLANEYNLKPSVINVLLKYCLDKCNNNLIEKFVFSVASDLHRNNVIDPKQAIERLNYSKDNKADDKMPTYDSSNNPAYDEERLKELLGRRNKN